LEARLLTILDYPLTLVHAPPAMANPPPGALAGLVDRLAWYTITAGARPLLFLAHLICSFERLQPAVRPALQLLEESGGRVTPPP